MDTIMLDKTGTLTMGVAGLRGDVPVDERRLASAARIGADSHQPYAQALAAAATSADLAFDTITEHAGLGLEARIGEDVWRLGRGEWALGEPTASGRGGTVLACNGRLAQAFAFEDALRPGAVAAVAALRSEEHTSELQSLMSISYAVFCLKKKTKKHTQHTKYIIYTNYII